MTERFLKRLRRWLARKGHRNFGSDWAQVVECDKSGWPHVNNLVHPAELAAILGNDNAQRRRVGQSKHGARLLNDDLRDHATACGWGIHSSAEQLRNFGEMTKYPTTIAKYGHEHAQELAKLPHNAPRRFRRPRSGKGFLPQVRKNKEWTGVLVRRYYDPQLGYTAQALKGKA